jgi:hypothetical protein
MTKQSKKQYWHTEEYDLILVVFPTHIIKFDLLAKKSISVKPTTIDPDNFKEVTRAKALKILAKHQIF